jgi:predicted RNase H-like nuclease (RuvC/YqgF family)
MAIWKRVREDSDRGMRLIRTKMFAVGRRVAEETEIAKRRHEIRRLDEEAARELINLGDKVFGMAEKGEEEMFRDRDIQELISKIEKLYKHKKDREDEIREIENGTTES